MGAAACPSVIMPIPPSSLLPVRPACLAVCPCSRPPCSSPVAIATVDPIASSAARHYHQQRRRRRRRRHRRSPALSILFFCFPPLCLCFVFTLPSRFTSGSPFLAMISFFLPTHDSSAQQRERRRTQKRHGQASDSEAKGEKVR